MQDSKDALTWNQFIQLWDNEAIQLLDWLEEVEACLEKTRQAQKISSSLMIEVQYHQNRLEASRQVLDQIRKAFDDINTDDAYAEERDRFQTGLNQVSQRVQYLEAEISRFALQGEKPSKESELFLNNHIEPIPTGAPFMSSIESQLRTDLWYERDGIAVFSKIAKNNPKNYIEHYISSPGDVTLLPWDAAEKIINNFGFNTVKLQLILAAHAMNQSEPWSSGFTLSGDDVIRNLGWNSRKDLTVSQKLSELAACAFALDCLLVRVEWQEGKTHRRKTQVTVQTSRMWNISVSATGQKTYFPSELRI